jgi:hypothetical protein
VLRGERGGGWQGYCRAALSRICHGQDCLAAGLAGGSFMYKVPKKQFTFLMLDGRCRG